MSYYVYILRTVKNTLYTGLTTDLDKRLKEHRGLKSGGAKYTKAFGASEIVYKEEYPSRSEATKREIQIKKLSRKQKETLVLTMR